MPNQINLAIANFKNGKNEDALAILKKIVEESKEHAFAWFLSGVIHTQQGEAILAITEFENALKSQPNYPEALNNMGVVLESVNRVSEATKCYKTAIYQKKDYANAYYNLANIQKCESDFTNAIENYSLAIKYKPDYSSAMNNLALIYQYHNNYKKSESLLKDALVISNNDPEIKNNLAFNYFCLFQYNTALSLYQEILQAIPDYSPTLLNCGLLVRSMGRVDEARDYFITLSKNPQFHMQAMNNLAHLELSIGNYKEGWEHYRYRPSIRNSSIQTIENLPVDINNKSILIYKDQGIGDEIFLARYIPILEKYGAKLSYFTDEKLVDIWQRKFCDINIMASEPFLEEFNYVISLGELPRLLYRNGHTEIPPPIKLTPSTTAIKRIKNLLPDNGKQNIAITWEAGVMGQNTLFKRIPPNYIGDQLSSTDANILILQRSPKKNDIKIIEKTLGRKTFNLSFLNNDLEEMLALLSVIDEYLCVSNTNTHLMATLNRRTHVFIPHPPEWRWSSQNEVSPWFPNCIIHRQDSSGYWRKCVDTIKEKGGLLPDGEL